MCAMQRIGVIDKMFVEILVFSKIHIMEKVGAPPDDFSFKHTHVH